MNIVWHGSYALYFEDAREQFGKEFGLTYMGYFDNGYYAPIVDISFSYRKPLLYGQQARVDIIYRNIPAAKVIFDYEIRLTTDDSLIATGT
jgi:acyl-CoA thioester hydrolase